MLKAFFLAGPTATGKTAVCQLIAETDHFDILSADAMLVYRGMNIGTAKPDDVFRSRVRYWGLDLVDAHETFSVGMYRDYALSVFRETAAAGRRLIVTGGTGLYIKSLTHGLRARPAADEKIRTEADEIMRRDGVEALQRWTERKAPELYEALADKKNPRRLVRAVEAAQNTVAGPQAGWRELGPGPKILGLAMPMGQLHERIRLRVEAMYAGGLLGEAERLLKAGIETSSTAGKAIGYAEAIGVLRGALTPEDAVAKTAARTRQLAKRQMTWFRNQANVEWLAIDSATPIEAIAGDVLKYWKKNGPTPIAG